MNDKGENFDFVISTLRLINSSIMKKVNIKIKIAMMPLYTKLPFKRYIAPKKLEMSVKNRANARKDVTIILFAIFIYFLIVKAMY